MQLFTKSKYRIFAIIFFTFSLFRSATARALSVQDVGLSIGLSGANLGDVVVKFLNWGLGLLGVIAVAMIILGGFQWLISGGNDENVATAKKTIGNAVIGIVLILLAWAIVHFTIGTTQNVSGM